MRHASALTAATLITAGLPMIASAAPIANGGFETGDFSSWTTEGDTKGLAVRSNADMASSGDASSNPLRAFEGSYFAVFNTAGASSITQVVTGNYQSYDLNFWATGQGFNVLWDGVEVGSNLGGGYFDSSRNQPADPQADTNGAGNPIVYKNGYENYDIRVAGNGAYTHKLTFYNSGSMLISGSAMSTPAAFAYMPAIDGISVADGTSATQVPEPASVVLLGIGLLGMTAAMHRKKSRPQGLVPTGSLDPNWITRKLRREEGLLRRAGIGKLTFAGSVARGQGSALSDVDVVATFKDGLNLRSLKDLVKLTILERHLSHALGRSVDVLPSDTLAEKVRLTTSRDAIQVF